MEKKGKLKLYSLDEMLDKHIGPEDSPHREEFEYELKLDVLATKIKELRKQQNLTQEALGKLIGKDKTQISKIEKGGRNITISTFLDIMKALNAKVKFSIEVNNETVFS
jgi:DNA-binding XRE family transcriptional regulator